MPAIRLAAFTGEQPRVAPRLLPPTGGKAALNVRLDNGVLTPYRKPTFVQAIAAPGPYGTIYRHGEDWLAFPGTVHAAPGPVATDRLYYTGVGKPKLRTGADTFDLEVPRPTAAPTATPSGSGTGDVQTRVYVYTFVTSLGEESEPSPASNQINWQPGQTVTLSGIQNAPGSPLRGITHQRFYRSQTGTVGTDLYFIAERSVGAGNYVDNVAVDAFAEPLPSRHWNAPPDDLEGLIALPNGMMAGFVGKRIYFCEPYRPHAWPEIYALTTDVEIVALAAAGTTVWVLTKGVPYTITGSTPDTMVMNKVEANLPCINARGVVDLGYSVAWPSNDGLAVARADGRVGLATQNLFAPRDWKKLNPNTMRAGQVAGRWIGSYDAVDDNGLAISGSLLIDLSEESFLIRSTVRSDAWFYDIEAGYAYFLDGETNEIRLFDSPNGDPETLYWRSKEFVLPAPNTFGCILVETGSGITPEQVAARQAQIASEIAANEILLAFDGGVGGELAGEAMAQVAFADDLLLVISASLGAGATINVYADSVLVATLGTLNRVVRLPAGFLARIWEIDVFSDIEIAAITMARTADELKLAAGGP